MKKKNTSFETPYRIGLVVWEDSHATDEDTVDPAIYDDPRSRTYLIWTVGWIIKDDKLGVVITPEYHITGQIEKPTNIPKSAIRHFRYLE